MPPIAIGFGSALIVLGVGFYLGTDRVSVTALIPAFFGIVFVVLGVLGRKEKLRKHVMHAAAALGLVGIVIPIIRLGPAIADEKHAVATELGLMALLCAVFVGLCVRSFIMARRNRVQSENP